ncbi:hypothetical protein D9615_007884 [Tricholomella constricta]|uniref:Uncharacterized protein n=1 Tax=Tricholomella constricta TaxID=117010 RepID=A0A8H5H4S1_9AGAR|nr:hypothetical protein D9615_007884 [Tricholomella constricta]
MASDTIIIDDVNPRIAYTGFWERGGVGSEYNSTTHGTASAGSRATIKFNGRSSIAVYGTIGRENNNGHPSFAPITEYSIDGSAPSSFKGTPMRGVIYRQLFFQSPTLEEGEGKEHTLVIENTLPGRNMFRLDYLQLISSTERPSTSGPAGTGESSFWSILLPIPAGTGGPYSYMPSYDLLRGFVMGSFGLLLFLVCIVSISIRRRARLKRSASRDEDLTLDFLEFRRLQIARRRLRRRADSQAYNTAFDEDREAQIVMLGEDNYPHADTRAYAYPERSNRSIPLPRSRNQNTSAIEVPSSHLQPTGHYPGDDVILNKQTTPNQTRGCPVAIGDDSLSATTSAELDQARGDIPPAYDA